MRARMAEHEVRCPRANAEHRCALTRRLDELGMRGKTKVIVTAERDVLAPVDGNARSLRRLQHAAMAKQTFRSERRELAGETVRSHQSGAAFGSIRFKPSRANSASSFAASGLPVVNSFSP